MCTQTKLIFGLWYTSHKWSEEYLCRQATIRKTQVLVHLLSSTKLHTKISDNLDFS
ncbi:hypothetical protein Hanom_Chr02g00132011 [Helianthus anomalus]